MELGLGREVGDREAALTDSGSSLPAKILVIIFLFELVYIEFCCCCLVFVVLCWFLPYTNQP